jgi:hypothetical protein
VQAPEITEVQRSVEHDPLELSETTPVPVERINEGPDRAASLLPGLLAATRTGLTPAGDDELMSDHDLHIDLQLWAHPRQVVSTRQIGIVAPRLGASALICTNEPAVAPNLVSAGRG